VVPSAAAMMRNVGEGPVYPRPVDKTRRLRLETYLLQSGVLTTAALTVAPPIPRWRRRVYPHIILSHYSET
jgi:hypothetical protein